MKKMRWIAMAVLLFSLLSCGESQEKGKTNSTENNEKEVTTTPEKGTIIGVLEGLNDSGIPGLFVAKLTVKGKEDFYNYEGEPNKVELLIGKQVEVTYQTKEEARLIDVLIGGISIDGEYSAIKANGGTPNAQWKSITGKIVSSAVSGDLPTTFTITPTEGEAISFETFITNDLFAKNGQEATVYYSYFTSKTASSIVGK